MFIPKPSLPPLQSIDLITGVDHLVEVAGVASDGDVWMCPPDGLAPHLIEDLLIAKRLLMMWPTNAWLIIAFIRLIHQSMRISASSTQTLTLLDRKSSARQRTISFVFTIISWLSKPQTTMDAPTLKANIDGLLILAFRLEPTALTRLDLL